jgi:hypothetical protein
VEVAVAHKVLVETVVVQRLGLVPMEKLQLF